MKKIIPPLLFLFCIALMIGLDRLYPIISIMKPPLNLLGMILVLGGLMLPIVVRYQFKKIQTEIHTFKNPRKFVTSGLFRISRNPIYLGFTICLTGIWITLESASPLVGILLFFVTTNFWYIPYEEKVMAQTFGDAYFIYKEKVRRWI